MVDCDVEDIYIVIINGLNICVVMVCINGWVNMCFCFVIFVIKRVKDGGFNFVNDVIRKGVIVC